MTTVITIGFVMRYFPQTIGLTTTKWLLSILIAFSTFSANGEQAGIVVVNIFGDGNPENGLEDSREQLMDGQQRGINPADLRVNAGTLKCDGKVRGTAMVVDTREFAPGLKGVVLASAAHVIYDLDKKRRFKRCEFHFLALAENRAKVDLRHLRIGAYNPVKATGVKEFGEGDWIFLYVPKPWKNFNPDQAFVLREFSLLQMEPFQQYGGEFRLIAFDSTTGVISVSRNCSVIESSGDDLGGGVWEGQLLDDCDSVGGASGGGIVAVLDKQQYMVGIRNGSHWSEQAYPASEYPSGPPGGSAWNRHTNTNFGRAIDASIINDLKMFTRGLQKKNSSL